jgi:predicted Zn-dependent protease
VNADHQQVDVHWLADRVQPMVHTLTGIELKYTNSSGKTERLEVRDEVTISQILRVYRHKKFAGGKEHSRRYVLPLALLGSIAGLFLIAYFFIIPLIGEKVAKNISKEWEIDLGSQMYNSMMEGYTIDPKLTSMLNRFYMATGYDLPYNISITVIKEKELNAFALPGGNIVVHDAILKEMNSYEELAALLGHEASHISERHSLRNLFRTFSRKMFLSLLIGNNAGIAGVLVDQADALKGLEYSRELETEADNKGIDLMTKNKIDANGMVSLMKLLQSSERGDEPSAFLSTHPVFKERIANIKEKIRNSTNTPVKQEELATIFQSIKQP